MIVISLIAFSIFCLHPCVHAEAGTVISDPESLVFSDPAGDDTGSGSYTYPEDKIFTDGSLDLTQVKISQRDQDIIAEVQFRVPVAPPPDYKVNGRDTLSDLCSLGFFFQVVDIYFDLGQPHGFRDLLPGRGVTLTEAYSWNKALIIHPQPQKFRSELSSLKSKEFRAASQGNKTERKDNARKAMKEFMDHVLVPDRVSVSRNNLQVVLPPTFLKSVSEIKAVLIIASGSAFEQSETLQSMLKKSDRAELFIRPVMMNADEWNFGGGAENFAVPIIDLIAEPPSAQFQLLSVPPNEKQKVTLPMVSITPTQTENKAFVTDIKSVTTPSKPSLFPVISHTIDVITAQIPKGFDSSVLFKGQIAEMLNSEQKSLGTAIITSILGDDGLLVLKPVTPLQKDSQISSIVLK